MRGLFLSLSALVSDSVVRSAGAFHTLLVGAGNVASREGPHHLLDTPASFERVSEAQTPLHLTYRRLPQTFEQNQGQVDLRMRFFPPYPDYRLPTNTNAALYPATSTAELSGKGTYPIYSAPSNTLGSVAKDLNSTSH
jgi:hypothetical protein